MADYISLAVLVFVINIIPAFMPPTWIVLALARLDDPSFDPLLMVLVGAISSTAGRSVLAYYCTFFRRFFTPEISKHAEDVKGFFEKKQKELFAGTFIYSLSPFPSNLIFIAEGLTDINWVPVFSGFFLGRLVSYFTLVEVSHGVFHYLMALSGNETMVRYAFDIVGILAASSVLLVDWRKLFGQNGNDGKKKR